MPVPDKTVKYHEKDLLDHVIDQTVAQKDAPTPAELNNGCWLPENTAATPHPAFPKAVPHSRIHRFNYYFWLRTRLGSIRQELQFRKTLQLTARHLHERTLPEYVLLKKGQGLPNGGQIS